jgi:signal transduction histidine kinase
MAKLCNTCGRPRHDGLCDMVTLSDGRHVHRERVRLGGDLHDQIGDDLKVANVWRKFDTEQLKMERDERPV